MTQTLPLYLAAYAKSFPTTPRHFIPELFLARYARPMPFGASLHLAGRTAFESALLLAQSSPDCCYCEGLALFSTPTLHAWVTRGGAVLDPFRAHEYAGVQFQTPHAAIVRGWRGFLSHPDGPNAWARLEARLFALSAVSCSLKHSTFQMKRLYIYRVKTEACDVYRFTSNKELTREQLAKKVWVKEGKCASLKFYEDTIDVEEF